MLGKLSSRFVALLTVLMLSVGSLVTVSSASFQTKETPYGTMKAISIADWDDHGHGPEMRSMQYTCIDSSVTMRKITTSVEAQYADTGEVITSGSHVVENANETPDYDWDFWFDDPTRGCVVYSAHQVLYTNAYVIYLKARPEKWTS